MIRRYYEQEMHYLHDAGRAYAEAHPEQARYMNIESVADRDPYVERLFEGFALLAGRIHERLDDELPEYTESLFNLMWPHFLRPVPALAILEFQPRPGLVQETVVLDRGLEVRSGPVGDEGVVCRFSTTQPVRWHPMQLQDLTLNWTADGKSNVALAFRLERGIEYQKLKLNPLRLYFHAEPTIASMMYLFFTRYVSRLVIRAEGESDCAVELVGQGWVRPASLAPDEGLLPDSRYSFSGLRLLQEYLCFRQKFWFVDVHGLDRFEPPLKTSAFRVEMYFDRPYPEERSFKSENVRLYCTPIVNLFRQDSEPVRVDHLTAEYRVVPSARYPKSIEVYNIEAVMSVEEATGKRHRYLPFFSFRHSENGEDRYYTMATRVGPSDRYETYISVFGQKEENGGLPVETLSLEVTCTNGALPREKLQEGMITQPAPDFTNIAIFRNLTQPTLDLHPPTEQHRDFFWKLISHLSFNYMSVASKEALVGLLQLYDWTGTDANQRRIAGIREVSWAPKEMLHRGAVIRGAEVTIEVQDGHFADEGDLWLFGTVMSRFFSMYATINSFVHLTLISMPSGKRYQWRPRNGRLWIV
jgi:type VI secretion system protein ImpG